MVTRDLLFLEDFLDPFFVLLDLERFFELVFLDDLGKIFLDLYFNEVFFCATEDSFLFLSTGTPTKMPMNSATRPDPIAAMLSCCLVNSIMVLPLIWLN